MIAAEAGLSDGQGMAFQTLDDYATEEQDATTAEAASGVPYAPGEVSEQWKGVRK